MLRCRCCTNLRSAAERVETYALVMRIPPFCGGEVEADTEGKGTEEDGADAVYPKRVVVDQSNESATSFTAMCKVRCR